MGLWACGSGTAPVKDVGPTGTGGTGQPTLPSNPPPDPKPTSSGTQTGGEGEQLNCGNGPRGWVVVDESLPFEGTFTGQLLLGSGVGSWKSARLSLAQQGEVRAPVYDADAGSIARQCAEGRLVDANWSLSLDGLLEVTQRVSVGYSTDGRGAFGAVLDLPDAQVLATAPTPQAFRDAGDGPGYAGWADAGDGGSARPPSEDGPVRLSLYNQLDSPTSVRLQLMWTCGNCGTNRVGLSLADGTLTR